MRIICVAIVFLVVPAPLLADPLPKTIPSAACKTPPTIDGVIEA